MGGVSGNSLHETMHAAHHQNYEFFYNGKARGYERDELIKWIWAEGVAEYGALKIHQTILQQCVTQLRDRDVSEDKIRIFVELVNTVRDRFYKQTSKGDCLLFLEQITKPEFEVGEESDKKRWKILEDSSSNWSDVIYALGVQYIKFRIEHGETILEIMAKPPVDINEFKLSIT